MNASIMRRETCSRKVASGWKWLVLRGNRGQMGDVVTACLVMVKNQV